MLQFVSLPSFDFKNFILEKIDCKKGLHLIHKVRKIS